MKLSTIAKARKLIELSRQLSPFMTEKELDSVIAAFIPVIDRIEIETLNQIV